MKSQKLDQLVKTTKETLTAQAQTEQLKVENAELLVRTAEWVGAANAIQRIATSLNAQAIRAWEQFQAEEGYKLYGYDTFVDFLNGHPHLGLTKSQYYDQRKVLTNEGEELFDLLNSLRVPVSTRKQIGAGSIEVNGDTITVGDKTASISDAKAVKALFKEAADAFERVEDAAKKEQQKLTKLMKRAGFKFGKDEAGKEQITPPDPQPGTNTTLHDDSDPQTFAAYRLIASYASYEKELAALDVDAANAHLERFRHQIQEAMERLLYQASKLRIKDEAEAAQARAAKASAKAQGEAEVDTEFTADELSDLMDD